MFKLIFESAKLAHELSDCLWCVLVLSKLYEVDIQKEFMSTMDDLDKWITQKLKEPNQPPQHNAGSRPSSDDSSTSETPSTLGPRG